MSSEKRKREYAAGRALLRWGLKEQGHSDLPEEFPRSPQGKPECPGGPSFSLSHSSGVVLLALSKTGPIGADLEVERDDRSLKNLLDRVATPSEHLQFSRWSLDETRFLFFKLWVLKEAFAKNSGKGNLGLREFGFDLTSSPWRPEGELADFKFIHFKVRGHQGAVCVESSHFVPPQFFELEFGNHRFQQERLSVSYDLI